MKKWFNVTVFFLVFAVVVQLVSPLNTVVAEAVQVKLNTSNVSIRVGQTYTLKVTGTSKKVIWTSSNNKMVTVNDGKIKGVKTGSTTLTATVDKKKYTAKVTVVNPMSAKDLNCTGSTTLSNGFIDYCNKMNYTNAYYYFDDADGDSTFKTNRGTVIGSLKNDIIKNMVIQY